ncbi:hypothetical protein LCGC14_1389950 [marine sediment metagenome]|uniref:Uncharacterized protein n=1 Tax=marine sediment metagenome TaxID=412755 RepID=A0A0F9K0G7_9ZZZZ
MMGKKLFQTLILLGICSIPFVAIWLEENYFPNLGLGLLALFIIALFASGPTMALFIIWRDP